MHSDDKITWVVAMGHISAQSMRRGETELEYVEILKSLREDLDERIAAAKEAYT